MRFFSILIITFIFLNIPNIYSQPWASQIDVNENNFFKVQESFTNYWNNKELVRGKGWKQFKRWEYMWEQRTFPTGKIPKAYDILNSYTNFINKSSGQSQLLGLGSDWEEIGPINVPQNKLSYSSGGLGRVNVIRVHPVHKNTLWAGTAGGGAWFTTNRGLEWTKSEFTDVLSLGISDIAFAPSKPDVMYLSTGDKNGFFMTDEYSVGILKSIDGGKNWSYTGEKYKANDYYLANKILVHPNNHNLVYAATNKGILISKNGGDSWEIRNGSTIFRDMVFHPTNPQIIYASTSGMSQGISSGRIFKSKDGGESWALVYSMNGSSRIELAVTLSNPNYLYALAARSSGGFLGLARSEDSGTTFSMQSTTPNILSIDVNGNDGSGQGFYDLALAVSPNNPELVFAGGIHTWTSTNGGKNWSLLNHWTGSYNLPYVHADQQNLTFTDDGQTLYASNDGGVYFSTNNGKNWTDISSGLAIAQFYKIDVTDAAPDLIVGGTQDNGSSLLKDGKWAQVNGGDGMDCSIDPENPDNIYTSTQYGNIFRSNNRGNSFVRISGPDIFQNETANWVTPFEINPKNSKSVFVGYRNIYKSTNYGSSWIKLTSFTNSAPINLISISELDTNIMYMAVRNYLYKSTNGGSAWNAVFNKSSWITGIAIDPNNAHRVFVTLSGYTQSDRVIEIAGTQIKNITYNLPNVPANTIIVQKNSSGRIFIGTDIGVMIKADDFSEEWNLFNEKLPPVVINDLKIVYSSGKLIAGTYGRGVWETKLYDCSLPKPEIKIIGNIEFCAGDSVVLEAVSEYNKFRWSTGDTTNKIVVKESGYYYVSIIDDIGCSANSETISVQELFVPSFSIRSNKNMVLCGENDTISLSVPIGLQDYKWSNGENSFRISVFEPGFYTVSANTINGCPLFDSIYIPMRPAADKPNIYYESELLSTDSATSYSWYLNNKILPGSNSRVLKPAESGEYFVIAFNEYGCGNSSDVVNVTTSVRINNNSSDKFSISPNPFNNYIRITAKFDIMNVEIEIIDFIGRRLVVDNVQQLNSGQDFLINLGNLPVGSYILLIKDNNEINSFNIKRFN